MDDVFNVGSIYEFIAFVLLNIDALSLHFGFRHVHHAGALERSNIMLIDQVLGTEFLSFVA